MNKGRTMCLLLREIKKNPQITQRDLAKAMNVSIGVVNKTIKDAKDFLVKNECGYKLTSQGTEYLEKFAVKNAIILAAGFGSRMAPLTYQMPKGLVRVKGTPMIERIIEQLHDAGIREIIVVTGYLCRNFDYLASKYGVKLVFNLDYKNYNNLYSISCVAEYLSSSYIICQDNWIENNIFNKFEPVSWYACNYFAGPTNEWCVEEGSFGRIKEIKIGGEDCFGLLGPAYLTQEVSNKYKKYLQQYLSQPLSKNFFWEDVLVRHLDDIQIYVNDQTGNILEFDNVQELGEFDSSYKEIKPRNREDIDKIMNNIDGLIHAFGCDKVAMLLSEDGCFEKLKDSMTNVSYIITWQGKPKVLRFAGKGTDKFINREREKFYTSEAVRLGCCPHTEFYNDCKIKITDYIDNARTFTFEKDDLGKVLDLLKKFYSCKHGLERSIKSEIEAYEVLYKKDKLPEGYDFVRKSVLNYLYNEDGTKKYELGIAHCDIAPVNILVDGDKYYIIDFEYAGLLSKYWDFGDLVTEIETYQNVKREDVIAKIVEHDSSVSASEILTWSYIADFIWTCWALAKAGCGEEYSAYSLCRFQKALEYFKSMDSKF